MTTEQTPTTASLQTIIWHGIQRSETGALVGWRGDGELTHGDLVTVLQTAGLDPVLAPTPKCTVAVLGACMSALRETSAWTVTKMGAAARDKETGTRGYASRWALSLKTGLAELGSSVATVAAVFEVRDDDDELYVQTNCSDLRIAAVISDTVTTYKRILADSCFRAGDVTKWLGGLLVNRFDCVRYSLGYYCPASSVEAVERLIRALAPFDGDGVATTPVWGKNWTSPMPRIEASAAIGAGIAAAFADEVETMATDLERETMAAIARGSDEVSERVALRYLRALSDFDSRVSTYRELCGEPAIAGTRDRIRDLKNRLSKVASGTGLRFDLLEIDVSPVTESDRRDVAEYGPAGRSADAALVQRQGQSSQTTAPSPDATVSRFQYLELDPDPVADPCSDPNWQPPGVVEMASWASKPNPVG